MILLMEKIRMIWTLSNEVSTWSGITLGQGSVTDINLTGRNLVGTIRLE